MSSRIIEPLLLALGVLLLGTAFYIGLVVAPSERMMGDVYRIMYVHVPSAWMGLLAFTTNFVCSLAYLFNGKQGADACAKASAQVGVFFSVLTIATGAIWGRPTWGVWWTWAPRLTTEIGRAHV